MTTQIKTAWAARSGKIKARLRVGLQLGLNLKIAAELVGLASKFKSRIVAEKDGAVTDAKSLIGLLSLTASYGTKVTFTLQGGDGREALAAIRRLLESESIEKTTH